MQSQHLGGFQLFSEAAEKSKCAPALILGPERGWIERGQGGGESGRSVA